jgi:quercetin dioxygenase-like cupin family protein
MPFYQPNNREYKTIAAGVFGRTFWGERMLISLVDLDSGSLVTEHSHPHEQVGFVISGWPTFTINGELRRCSPGDVYIIPAGALHSVENGESPAQVFEVFSPVREDFQY